MSIGSRLMTAGMVLGFIVAFADASVAQVDGPGGLEAEVPGAPAPGALAPAAAPGSAGDQSTPTALTGAVEGALSAEDVGVAPEAGTPAASAPVVGAGGGPTGTQPVAPPGPLETQSVVFSPVSLLDRPSLPLTSGDIDAASAQLRLRLDRIRAELVALRAAQAPPGGGGGPEAAPAGQGSSEPGSAGEPGKEATPPSPSAGGSLPDGAVRVAPPGSGVPEGAAPVPDGGVGDQPGSREQQPAPGAGGDPSGKAPMGLPETAPAASPSASPTPEPPAPNPGGPAQAPLPGQPQGPPGAPSTLWDPGAGAAAGGRAAAQPLVPPLAPRPDAKSSAPGAPAATPSGLVGGAPEQASSLSGAPSGGASSAPVGSPASLDGTPAQSGSGTAPKIPGSALPPAQPSGGDAPGRGSDASGSASPPGPAGAEVQANSMQMLLDQLAPFVPTSPPVGPGQPYFPEDPTVLGSNDALAKTLQDRATDLRSLLDAAPALRETLEAELFQAVASAWACGAPDGSEGSDCSARRGAVAAARGRMALVALQEQVARAEVSLIGEQIAWIQRVGDWARSEARRHSDWDRARQEREREVAAAEATKRAEIEAAAAETTRLAREKAAKEAEQLAQQKEASLAALAKAKTEQEVFLRQQKAEEDKRQRDRELEQLYQDIVDITGKHTAAVEDLTKRAALREVQRQKSREFIEVALKEDVHVAGLIRKVQAGELEPKVLDARHEEFALRLERARGSLGDSGLDEAEARVEAAASELRSRNGDVEVAESDTVQDVELHTKRIELLHLEVDLAQTRLDAASAERDRIAIVANLRKAERILYSSLLRRIAPYLSATYLAKVLAVGGSFADGLFKNLIDLSERLTDLLGMRLEDLRELPGRLSSWKGVTAVVWYLGELAVLILVALWARRRLPVWMVQVVQGAGSNPWLRRNLPAVVMVAKIVNAIGRPAILLLASYLLGGAVGRSIPEVEATLFVLAWFFAWRMSIELLRVTFLHAAPPKDGDPETLASIDPAPIIRIAGPLANIAYRSAWGMVHYLVLRNATLIAVEALLGRFYLYRALTNVFDVGFVVLAVYLMLAWRSSLLGRFAEVAPPTWGRTIEWAKRNRDRVAGVVAVPPIIVWLLLVRAWPFLRQKLREASLSRSLANYFLRRRMERAKEDAEAETTVKRDERAPAGHGLPADFVQYFELSPLVDEPWLVVHDETLATILKLRAEWEPLPSVGAVAIVAEPGLGKTTILNQLERRLAPGSVRRVSFDQRVRTERQLITVFAKALGLDELPSSIDELKDRIMEAPETTWLLDDTHRLFLKVIGGMEALDALFDLIAATGRERFWIATFDSFTWYFIQSLRKGRIPFARIVKERKWTEEQIQELVISRTRAAGYEVTFEDLVVTRGDNGAAATYQVVKTAEGYYRLLGDYADGNPAIALGYWLRSLTPRTGRRFSVGLFSRRSTEMLATASDEVLFTFTSIAEHSGMPIPDIARVLGYEEALVERYVRRGIESGLLAQIGRESNDRIAIHFDAFRQVISLLRTKNFIYFSHKE